MEAIEMQERQGDLPLVLVVEDNVDDERLTLRGLRTMPPTKIEVAHDGAQAIRYLTECHSRSCTPDLILLDLKMPKMSGFDVLRWMRAHPRFKCVPVVVFSSSDEDMDRQMCETFGVALYQPKPVEFSEYIAAVRTAVQTIVFDNLE